MIWASVLRNVIWGLSLPPLLALNAKICRSIGVALVKEANPKTIMVIQIFKNKDILFPLRNKLFFHHE
jgi:hypothetical protein